MLHWENLTVILKTKIVIENVFFFFGFAVLVYRAAQFGHMFVIIDQYGYNNNDNNKYILHYNTNIYNCLNFFNFEH